MFKMFMFMKKMFMRASIKKKCNTPDIKAAQRSAAGQTISDCPTGSIIKVICTATNDFSALIEFRDSEQHTHPKINATIPVRMRSIAAIAVPTSLPTSL